MAGRFFAAVGPSIAVFNLFDCAECLDGGEVTAAPMWVAQTLMGGLKGALKGQQRNGMVQVAVAAIHQGNETVLEESVSEREGSPRVGRREVGGREATCQDNL